MTLIEKRDLDIHTETKFTCQKLE